MTNKRNVSFILFSALLLTAIIVWTAVRLVLLYQNQTKVSETNFRMLKSEVVSAYLPKGTFESEFFSQRMKAFFEANQRCRALFIYSRTGLVYLYAVNPSYVTNITTSFNNWTGPIEPQTRRFFEKPLTSSLSFPDNDDILVTSVYNIVTTDQLFQVLRDSAIAITVLLLITLLFIILQRRPSTAETIRSAAETPAETVSSTEPQPAEGPISATTDLDSRIEPVEDIGRDEKPSETATFTVESTPHAMDGEETETVFDSKSATNDGSIDENGLFSPHSGVGWENYLENRLGFELRRAASFDQDIVIALMTSEELRKEKAEYRIIAGTLIDFFTFQDLIFEYDDNGFSVIIPNCEIDEGIKKMEQFLKKLKTEEIDQSPTFSIGLSSRNGRLLSGQRLLNEAKKALEKAICEPGITIIGFRSDPVKYRKYIASKL